MKTVAERKQELKDQFHLADAFADDIIALQNSGVQFSDVPPEVFDGMVDACIRGMEAGRIAFEDERKSRSVFWRFWYGLRKLVSGY